jgi:hypothetical protein
MATKKKVTPRKTKAKTVVLPSHVHPHANVSFWRDPVLWTVAALVALVVLLMAISHSQAADSKAAMVGMMFAQNGFVAGRDVDTLDNETWHVDQITNNTSTIGPGRVEITTHIIAHQVR